ncbi:MAG: hypothetical protein V1792_02480 [Pseudomonadota bacterium]
MKRQGRWCCSADITFADAGVLVGIGVSRVIRVIVGKTRYAGMSAWKKIVICGAVFSQRYSVEG